MNQQSHQHQYKKISQSAIDILKSLEQCRLVAYQDGGGVWTIGWGHTGSDVTPELRILKIQANFLLQKDLDCVEEGVNRLLTREVTQNQFDAICLFAYNVGLDEDDDTKAEGLGDSTLLRLVNAGDVEAAAKEFSRWNHDNGKVVRGLTLRRLVEKLLYETLDSLPPSAKV